MHQIYKTKVALKDLLIVNYLEPVYFIFSDNSQCQILVKPAIIYFVSIIINDYIKPIFIAANLCEVDDIRLPIFSTLYAIKLC